MRRSIAGVTLLALCIPIVSSDLSVATTCADWLVNAAIPLPRKGEVSQVATLGRADVWAAGAVTGLDGDDHPAIFHWDGARWSTRRFGTRPGSLGAIDVTSEGTVWAVGALGDRAIAVTSLNGWTRVLVGRRDANVLLHGVDADGDGDVWAVGETSAGKSRLLALRWNGVEFERTSVPADTYGYWLSDVAIVGDRVWSVGFQEGGDPLVVRWRVDRWRLVGFPSTEYPYFHLSEVESADPATVWIGGEHDSGTERGSDLPLLARWDHGMWTVTDPGVIPDPGYNAIRDSVEGLSALPDGSVLAAITHIPIIDDDLGDDEGPPTIQVRAWNGAAWKLETTLEGEGIRANGADAAPDGDAWVTGWVGKPFEPPLPFVARRCVDAM